MRYYKNIFMDKGYLDIEKTKSDILAGKSVFNAWLIYTDPDSGDMFEIAPSEHVFRARNKHRDYGIIAVSRGFGAARKTLKLLIEEWLMEHDDLKGIKEYYNSRCI